MQKITPFLWFDDKAEEAMNFYVSLFDNSKIVSIQKYPDEVPNMGGKVLTGIFELNGTRFMALDGGPMFKFSEAVSFYVDCKDQEEVDILWEALIADGGQESQCGWLKDKYGLSWQIVPQALGELMGKDKSGKVMEAMLKMKKIIVSDLEKAYKENN